MLANQGEFENVRLESLNAAAENLRQNINTIHQAASGCNSNLSRCQFPSDLSAPEIILPERVKGQVAEGSCRTPIYNAKSDPVCGAESYHVKTSPSCGVAQYMQGSGGPCGIASYNLASTPACGVNLYKLGTAAVCGTSEETRTIEVPGDRKLLWKSHPENVAKGNELCKGRVGPEWDVVTWEHPPRQIGFFFTRIVTCKRNVSLTCRNAAFGIESYNSCRHESHGVEASNSCRHPDFGVESYNACAHETHGVETYKTCTNPLFGYKGCAD